MGREFRLRCIPRLPATVPSPIRRYAATEHDDQWRHTTTRTLDSNCCSMLRSCPAQDRPRNLQWKDLNFSGVFCATAIADCGHRRSMGSACLLSGTSPVGSIHSRPSPNIPGRATSESPTRSSTRFRRVYRDCCGRSSFPAREKCTFRRAERMSSTSARISTTRPGRTCRRRMVIHLRRAGGYDAARN